MLGFFFNTPLPQDAALVKALSAAPLPNYGFNINYAANVICLQEIYITHAPGHRLTSHLFPTWFYGDSTSSRSRGVAIVYDRSSCHILY